MTTISLIFGASCMGWLLPEFFLMLSPHADRIKRTPAAMNLLSTIGMAAIAYGLRG